MASAHDSPKGRYERLSVHAWTLGKEPDQVPPQELNSMRTDALVSIALTLEDIRWELADLRHILAPADQEETS